LLTLRPFDVAVLTNMVGKGRRHPLGTLDFWNSQGF
jgi:hypothetical protein